MNIHDKVIVVTGAGHGIGAAIAERLASQGAKVAITYRHDKTGAEALVKKCVADGAEMKAYHVTDLADDKQCETFFQKVLEDFDRVDAVIANAGGGGKVGADNDLHNLDISRWQENLRDNLITAVVTTKHAIQALDKNEHGGKIILIGSILGAEGAGRSGISAYSAGKAATHNFGRSIAKALAPKIIVNVVAPGRCWSTAYEGKPEDYIAEKFSPNRHNRPIALDEIAHATQMVLENDSIIGQVINVEAGFTLIGT